MISKFDNSPEEVYDMAVSHLLPINGPFLLELVLKPARLAYDSLQLYHVTYLRSSTK